MIDADYTCTSMETYRCIDRPAGGALLTKATDETLNETEMRPYISFTDVYLGTQLATRVSRYAYLHVKSVLPIITRPANELALVTVISTHFNLYFLNLTFTIAVTTLGGHLYS